MHGPINISLFMYTIMQTICTYVHIWCVWVIITVHRMIDIKTRTCVFSCRSYSAWKSHFYALYYHLWPVCRIFFHIVSLTSLFSEKEMLLNVKCVLILYTNLCETCLILWKFQRGMITTVRRSSCKVTISLLRFNETWAYSTYCRKPLCQISWTYVQWEPSCFHVNRQPSCRFSQFCERT